MSVQSRLDTLITCIKKAFRISISDERNVGQSRCEIVPTFDCAIVYRTTNGFCCVYHGHAFEFAQMPEVKIWADERNVEAYYAGL